MAVAELNQEVLNTNETSQIQVIWERFRKHHLAIIGLCVLAILFFFSFIGTSLSRYSPETQWVGEMYGSPTLAFPFGTDELGRDVMTRMMWAGRVSLVLSLFVTICTVVIGIITGSLAGYFGGWTDTLIMRTVDVLLTLPTLPLLLILSAMTLRGGFPLQSPEFLNQFFAWIWGMSPDATGNVMVLVGILIVFGWMGLARLVRGQVLSLRNMEYAEAARSLGASSWHIIIRHMIPNSLAPIIVAATFSFGEVIVLEAALSFLGFGVQPPAASWGSLLNNVRDYMLIQPWRAFVPGMAIFLASISYNFIGDALRDALDPRLKL
ncbi:MAG: ABC transporter permease [Chloroflexi bacterium]|nr:ABC transporter permease [Chloroflexota bacterium]